MQDAKITTTILLVDVLPQVVVQHVLVTDFDSDSFLVVQRVVEYLVVQILLKA